MSSLELREVARVPGGGLRSHSRETVRRSDVGDDQVKAPGAEPGAVDVMFVAN